VSDPIISIRDLSHVYNTGPRPVVALDRVSLDVERGSCVALVGVGGSGKSTVVKHLNGILRPSSGQVIVDGVDVGKTGVDLTGLRRRVGMLFQSPEAQLFERTVFTDVAFGPRQLKLPRREIHHRVDAALDAVGLPAREFTGRSPFDLSGGQMRRVALAGVLATDPSILVLDEPTIGLDAAGRHEFYGYVDQARRVRGVTLILVSHDMSEVADLADRIVVMHHGRLAAVGSPREILTAVADLREWGLAPPPLVDLLAMVRARGLRIPTDILTLDEAVEALRLAGGVDAA
jgi:energy-coupling factor transport system ATP-binding protein